MAEAEGEGVVVHRPEGPDGEHGRGVVRVEQSVGDLMNRAVPASGDDPADAPGHGGSGHFGRVAGALGGQKFGVRGETPAGVVDEFFARPRPAAGL